MRFLAILTVFLAAGRPVLSATDPEITLQVNPSTIGLSERAAVVIEMNRRADQVSPPDTDAQNAPFTLQFSGESRQSQVSIVNGVMSSRTTFSYSFILTPRKTGRFSVEGFTVKAGGKQYTPSSARLTVVQNPRNPGHPSADPFAEINEFFHGRSRIPPVRFRLTSRPENGKVFQNQQMILEGAVESPDSRSFSYQFTEVSPIRSDKCTVYDISASLKDTSARKSGSGNDAVYRKTVRRYVLFPVETGRIGVAPPGIVAITPYGQFQLRSENIAVVSELLGNQAGLSYVGNLDIRQKLSATNTGTGRSVTLELVMTGDGNLKTLANLYRDVSRRDLFIPPPETSVDFLEMRGQRAYFRQTVRYAITASRPGTYEIPPVNLKYFDHQGHERSVRIPGFTLTAVKDSASGAARTSFVLKPERAPGNYRFLFFHFWFPFLLVVFALLPAAAFLFGRHADRMTSDPDYARRHSARNRFHEMRDRAKAALAKGDLKNFHSQLVKSVVKFLADRLELPPGVSRNQVLEELKKRPGPEQLTEWFNELYDECVSKAYGGTGVAGNPERLLELSDRIFRQLENRPFPGVMALHRKEGKDSGEDL